MSPRKRARRDPTEANTSRPLIPSTSSSKPPTALPTRAVSSSHASASSPALPTTFAPFSAATAASASASRLSLVHDAQQQQQQPPVKQVHKSRSWYGSWPRAPRSKAGASTQVARESILGGTLKPDTTPNLTRFDTKRSTDSDSDTPGSLSQLPPVEELDTPTGHRHPSDSGAAEPNGHTNTKSDDATSATAAGEDDIPPLPELQRPTGVAELPRRPATSSGWLGWLGRSAAPAPVQTVESTSIPENAKAQNPEAKPLLAPDSSKDDSKSQNGNPGYDTISTSASLHPSSSESPAEPAATSWFGFWPTSRTAPPQEATSVKSDIEQNTKPLSSDPVTEPIKNREDVVMSDNSVTSPEAQPAGSTWAFWSRDPNTKSTGSGKGVAKREPGEIAVIGEGSEAHPEPASTVDNAPPAAPSAVSKTKELPKKSKRVRAQSMDIDYPTTANRPSTATSVATTKTESSIKAATPAVDGAAKSSAGNLLLPSFRSTYRMKENPSIIQQIAQFLLRTQQKPQANHAFLTKEPPKIQKALAIGVHGLFPATYLRPMIGQPTGTSIRFANHAADSIRRWADSHGCQDCEIEKVALEGEGKIGERVENLWKLLLNWIESIRKADLILVACHSQGVPVSIMLVAKLIELGIITTPRIGVCAMERPLEQFGNPESDVSKRYEAALKAVLEYGVRVTYIGSIDDQVVPLESALHSPANHPLLFRAVFVDARVHAADFIAHLVGFALKLRNMGISDHGLIRELSVPLAGSLYSGAGHSTLYDDPQLYDLAVSHALETSDVGKVPCEIGKHEGITTSNPYHLPWIMRGLLEEDFVKTELSSEVTELLKQFDSWKPVTKALKDVKYRLEAVRSKL
ncbi:hypothetical protein M0657_005329 [Pyricularia oryzae]|uniref:YMC020W-like alpha/beta hydrolase domain-containing protein n=2 Tax=Pyricularia oryzae TaxID=318829 RepID=A0AA97NS31_PYRO3|nr:hypothetical protein OOU_Y34scaffold00711g15 [Pyricularia oryzae Y34]KAI7920596.1 hypothetical protein M9X92_005792 [Pyricularia oryzae]KAI7923007.1 hypothetical protein M0657_005329 [Pyricularia oryzae]